MQVIELEKCCLAHHVSPIFADWNPKLLQFLNLIKILLLSVVPLLAFAEHKNDLKFSDLPRMTNFTGRSLAVVHRLSTQDLRLI